MSVKIRKILPLWGCLTLILCAFYTYVYVINHYTLVFWGDQTEALIPYMIDLYTQFKESGFTLWNHSIGLGASNLVYYYTILGSPSFYLNLLLPTSDWIPYFIPVLDSLRFFLIGTAAWLWLDKLVCSDKAKLIGALIFTFSGWAMYWLHFSYFLDAYLYLALLLYFSEEILEGRKKLGFTLIICLSSIISPYILYMFSWLLLIYMICRLFMKYEKVTFKFFFQKFLSVFVYYLLGVALSAFALLPAGLMLLSTDRIGSGTESLFKPLLGGDLIRVITSLFSPVINDYDYNIFSSPFLKLDNRVYTVYNYSFILFVLLLPQLLKIKFRGKKPLIITSLVLYAMLLFPVFYLIFNGNTSIRWSFYYIVFNVMFIAYILQNEEQLDKRLLAVSGGGCILVLIGISLLSMKFGWTTEINQSVIKRVCVVVSGCVVLYTFSLLKNKNKFCKVLLISTVIVEAVFCMCLRVVNGTNSLVANSESWNEYQQKMLNTDAADFIKKQDSGFYRIDFADNSSIAYNYPIVKRYNGFTSYFNVYNHETRPLYDNRSTDNWFLGYQPSKFLLKSLLGSKYMITWEDNQFLIPHTYDLIYESSKQKVYKNSLDMSLGYASSKISGFNILEDLDKSQEDIVLLNSIVIPEAKNNESNINDIYPLIAENLVNSGFPWHEKEGYLFVDYSQSNPYGIVAYEFYKNGKQVKYEENYEYGYTAIRVDQDIDEVYIYCKNFNNINEYIPVNVYWISDKVIDQCFSRLASEDHFENVLVSGEDLSADITINNEKKWVATTIPYNPGWKVWDNGKIVDVKEVNEVFIGFELDEGVHRIQFKFMPSGLKLGLGISFGACIIVIFLGYKKVKASRYCK